MNQRIKELIKQADEKFSCEYNGDYTVFNKEKFAELLIRECIDTVSDCSVEYCTRPQIVSEIKQHFGVDVEK